MADSDNWRTLCKNLTESIAESRKRGLYVDVRFVVGLPPSYFNAHKMVLACGSPVFEAMFFGQLAEQKEIISIPDDDPQAFQIMLEYLYEEQITFPSLVVACKSFAIADKYLIPGLEAKSAIYIRDTPMDDENFWVIVTGGLFLNNKHVEGKLRRYVQVHAGRLVKCTEFLSVPEYFVTTFLQMNILDVPEDGLLSSVARWCLKNMPQHDFVKSRDAWMSIKREEFCRDHLRHIRFSLLTPKEFCLFTENFPEVFYAPTSLSILKHLIDPSSYDLPDWCSVNKMVRNPAKPHLPRRPTHGGRFGRPNL